MLTIALSLCAVAAHPTTIKTVYRITPRNYTGTTNLDTVPTLPPPPTPPSFLRLSM